MKAILFAAALSLGFSFFGTRFAIKIFAKHGFDEAPQPWAALSSLWPASWGTS